MSKTRLSRTAAVVVMTSALAWNLPVLAQDESENTVSVTVVSEVDAGDMLERGNEKEARRRQSQQTRGVRG